MRRLIKLEVNRKKPADLYDLDYDLQLQAALETLKLPNFNALVKSAKTIKELQADAASESAQAAKK